MSETLKLTASESVRIVNSSAAGLEVEATYGPGGEAPPAHLHPDQDEHFEVLDGALRVRIDGIDRELAVGDTLDVPRGSVHQMWNPATEAARVRWTTTPAGRTEQWFRELNELQRSGKTTGSGTPSPLAMGVLLREYRDVFRLAGPEPLLRPALSALGLAGRLAGNRPAHAGK
jgi:mannose-6-phosphate isomerase-like protein (cupin superfamily)